MRLTAGICEDDDELRGVVRRALERDGLEVRATPSGREAVRVFTDRPPDVLVLDIGLPDADGRDVCEALRGGGVRSPVLFLTAHSALPDLLRGYDAGADDYLAKPFAVSELRLRVAALLRRTRAPSADAALRLDPEAHAFVLDGARIPLTPVEFRIVSELAAARGDAVRRAVLAAAGWPDGETVSDGTLDAYLARIRRKLRGAGAPDAIETERGVGYRLR